MTRETLWGWMEEFAAVQFTDLEAGTCSFDSEEYIGLLRECGETSTDFPADISQNYVGLLQFEPLQGYMRLSVISGNYGGEYTFAGMPNGETNGSMFNIELSYAISAQSKHADGAWQFIRRCLGQERGVSSMSFPANAELFAEQLQTMVETGFDNYGQLVKISESDAEKLRGLVEGTTTVNYRPAHRVRHPVRGRRAVFCRADKRGTGRRVQSGTREHLARGAGLTNAGII